MTRKDSEFFFPKYGPYYWSPEHQALLRAHELANRRAPSGWPGVSYMPPPLRQPPIISPRPVAKAPTYAPAALLKPPPTPEEIEAEKKARRWLLLIAGCLCLFVDALVPIGLCLLAFWLWQITAKRRSKRKEAKVLDAAMAKMFPKTPAPKQPGKLKRLIAAIRARRELARDAKKAEEAKQAKTPALAIDKILYNPPPGYWTVSSVTALHLPQRDTELTPMKIMAINPLFKSIEDQARPLAPWEIYLWGFAERAAAVVAAIGKWL